jgi:hypothetical protein
MHYEDAVVSKFTTNACRIKLGLTKKLTRIAELKMVRFVAHLSNTIPIQLQFTKLILPQ